MAEDRSTKEIIKTYYEESLKWLLVKPKEFAFLAQFSNSPYLKRIDADEISSQTAPILQLFRIAIEEQQIAANDVNLLYALISNQVFGVNQYLSSNQFTEKEQHKIIGGTFSMFWRMIEC